MDQDAGARGVGEGGNERVRGWEIFLIYIKGYSSAPNKALEYIVKLF